MLPFFTGGNPFNTTPEQALAQGVQAAQGAPDPATTGAIAPPTPPAAPEGPGIMGTIGNKLSDAFSGRGLFGAQPGDDVADPATGITAGDRRAMGMQSMMKMGLLFLAAGQNMSADNRAAILSKAPGLVGGDGDLNSFAKSRLEMAKLKLEQRKQAMEEKAIGDQNAALQSLTGGGAPQASAGAQAVQTAQSGLQATGEAIGAGGTPGTAPAAGGAPMPAPMPTGNALSPGGVPRGPLLSPADAMGVMGAGTSAASRGAALNQAIQNAQARQTMDPGEQYDPTTNEVFSLQRNGRGEIVSRQSLGKPQQIVRDTPDGKFRETGYISPQTKQFVATGRTDIAENQADAEDRRMQASIIRDNYKDQYGTYKDTVQGAVQSYDKISKIRNDVLDGKGIFGTGAELWSGTVKALASYGMINPKAADDLMTNDNYQRALKGGVANLIKQFNGSQGVSNADREFAVQIMGASLGGTREQVLNSLTNAMGDAKNTFASYNENARAHNESAKGLPAGTAKLVTLPTVDRNFDDEEKGFADRYQAWRAKEQAAYEGKPAPSGGTPKDGVVRFTRDPKTGKLVRQ